MNQLALVAEPVGLQVAKLDETAANYAKSARSVATKAAYSSQMRLFEAWTADRGVRALPADPLDVATYLSGRAAAGVTVATLAQALTALSRAHVGAGYPSPRLDPTLREVWAGICRTEGTRPRRQARALGVDELRRITRAAKSAPELAGARDRALLLLGFAGGFRRSELVGLDVADLRADEDGLIVTIRRSKTDQTGKGRELGIPFGGDPLTCPVRAVRTWLTAANVTTGPLFRRVWKGGKVGPSRLTTSAVYDVVKRAAKRARVSPEALSGHSLRAGFVTAATKAGKSVRSIQDQTGHRSAATVARYVRSATIFDDNAAAGIGL